MLKLFINNFIKFILKIKVKINFKNIYNFTPILILQLTIIFITASLWNFYLKKIIKDFEKCYFAKNCVFFVTKENWNSWFCFLCNELIMSTLDFWLLLCWTLPSMDAYNMNYDIIHYFIIKDYWTSPHIDLLVLSTTKFLYWILNHFTFQTVLLFIKLQNLHDFLILLLLTNYCWGFKTLFQNFDLKFTKFQ